MRERSRSSLQTATVSSGGGSLAGSVAWHATSCSVPRYRLHGQELHRSRASGQDTYSAHSQSFYTTEVNTCSLWACCRTLAL